MSWSRRSFVGRLLAGGLLAGAALTPRRAVGGPLDGGLTSGTPYKVLEVFLNGGADLWPHLFSAPSFVDDVSWVSPAGLATLSSGDLAALFGPVTTPGWIPAGVDEQQFFGTSSVAGPVYWGPAARPLVASGLAARTRMVVVGHHVAPHEAAVPLALTGTSLGRPIGASLGAALNRNRPAGDPPVSFVLPVRSSGIPGAVLAAASATGFHGAANRPVVIACGSDHIFDQLDRDVATSDAVARADGDSLRAYYNGRYRSMLTHAGVRTRSAGYAAYEGSVGTLMDHEGVRSRLPNGMTFVPPATPDAVGNPTSTAIRAATQILREGAQHVMVLDTDWDTHDGSPSIGGNTKEAYARYILRKTYWLAHALAAASVAPDGLNLDDTLVFVHSEFGRKHEGNAGTAHHPYGYPVLLIGGPITTPGIVGDFGSVGTDPVSNGAYGPTAVRAAVALAAGLDPWHADMYTQSDLWLGSAVTATSASLPVLESNILGL